MLCQRLYRFTSSIYFSIIVGVFVHSHFSSVIVQLSFIQINTTNDEKDKSNPFRFPNIGVEKFLELNSEQNHDDYCLAYVFTDRDFDDGVLGLAWVGAPSGWYTTPNTYTKPWSGLVVCVAQGHLS